MKTKEEIIRHIQSVGYSKIARRLICAFMVGAKLKEKDEAINFLIKENKSFGDFMNWYDKDMPFDVRKQELTEEEQDPADSISVKLYNFFKLKGIQQDIKIGDTVCFGFEFGEKNKIRIGVIKSVSHMFINEKHLLILNIEEDNKMCQSLLIENFDFIFPLNEK